MLVSRSSVVGIATACGLDGRGVGVPVPVELGIFTFPYRLGSTQPSIQRAQGALSPRVKQPGPEADHSPTSAEVTKTWT
jgi:hypothetical protein